MQILRKAKMTKRKGKSTNKQDDSLLLLETPSVTPQRGFKEYAVPAIVFFIFAVGGSTAVWFCCQQQQTIDSLTETVNAMQLRITKFQQQLGMGNAQVANVGVFEERLQALEEAYTQAQKKADVALATSEKLKSTDVQNQVWSLQTEMNTKLSGLQQEFVSTASLNAVDKNKSEEIETLKQRLNSLLAANSEVSVTISGLTDTVLVTKSRLDEHVSAVESLTSELEEQRIELTSLKESFASNKKALQRNRQEVMDIKDLLQMEQAKESQALEEQLMSVRRSLEDHQKSTHNLHSHLAAQLKIVQSQMLSESQEFDSEEEIPEEDQQAEQVPTHGEVPIHDEVKVETVTTEDTLAKEINSEEAEQLVQEVEEPTEQVKVHEEEPTDGNEISEEAEAKEVVAEEVEQDDEDPFYQDEEKPDELQVFDEEKPTEEVPVQGEVEDIEKQDETVDESKTEAFEGTDGDVIDEQAVTEEEVVTEEDEGMDEDVIDEQGVTEEDVEPEDVETMAGDVSDEQAVSEVPVQEEEAVDEQIENVPAMEVQTYTKETEFGTSLTEVEDDTSEDQMIEDMSHEEMLQEPQDKTELQKHLVEVEEDIQDSHVEEEPTEDFEEDLDHTYISENES